MLVESVTECTSHGKAYSLNSDVATKMNKTEGGQRGDRLNGVKG